MPWDIDIEIVSFIFIVILSIYFFSRHNIPSNQNRIFGLLLINALFLSLSYMSIYITITKLQFFPELIIKYIVSLFMILRISILSLIFIYLVELSVRCRISIKKVILIQIPFYLVSVLYLISPLNDFMFEIKNNRINESFGGTISIIIIFLYLLSSLIYGFFNLKSYSKPTRTMALLFIILSIVFLFLHIYIYPDLNFTGLASSIGIIITFLSLQNPVLLNDEDTNTFNRKAFEQILSQLIYRKENIFIVTVALDNFKLVNQSFGIENGTKLLREVASFMNTIVKNYKAFRYYADSFSVIISGEKDADIIIEKITKRFRENWEVDEIVCTLSATTTIVCCPDHAKSLDEAALLIDFTLHEAKSSEKGQVFYCDEAMKNKMHRLKQIELSIVRGFENNSFEIYFQPIYSIVEKRFVSAEALARLYDDDLGYISPDEFISVAEGNGTINRLGMMIFERTCEFLNRHNPSQFGIENISINLSPIQSMQKGFIEKLEDVMTRNSIPKEMIRFEITESSKSDSMSFFNSFLNQLNRHEFMLYLDDYGSGYSTLSYLTKLPFNTVKIDKSIVWDAEDNDRSKKIISNTIHMLNQLKFNIIAEGVENKKQLLMLEKMGCHLVQGYYFCIPLSENDFMEFIKNNNKLLKDF